MRLRVVILLWVCLVAGGILFAQESPYLSHDISARLRPMPSVSSTMLNELQDICISGTVLTIKETQNSQTNPEYDLSSYCLFDHNKKYGKHVLYTITPKINTTFSYDSTGRVVSIDQEIVKTTYYKKIKNTYFQSKNGTLIRRTKDQRKSSRHSLRKPTCQSSQRIYNRFTFENGLPILWEQKDETQPDWQRIEALRYDSLQRIIKVYQYGSNNLLAITTYTYDADNRLVTETMFPFLAKKSEPPILQKQYLYNDSLQYVQVIDLLSDSISDYPTDNCSFTSQYDPEGRLRMIEGEKLARFNPYPNRCCSITSLIGKITFDYDDHGSLYKKCYYRGDHLAYSLTWKYEYDERGNWVKCSLYEGNHRNCSRVRKITYR